MVQNIRATEIICTDTNSRLTDSEASFSKAMRSVVAKSNINPGDIFTEENLTTKRPFLQGSLHAVKYYEILGKKASRSYETDSALQEGEIS